MEVYADQVTAGLGRVRSDGWYAEGYRPRIPRALGVLPISVPNRMRIARYGCYPWQARRIRAHLNHVLDQAYGHLTLALGGRRTIVTVHDLIPLLRSRGAIPHIAKDRRHLLFDLSCRALRRAAHLIAITENTKRDLIEHLGCEPERISVIYWGIDRSFSARTAAEREGLRAKLHLPANVHLVLASGTSFYKNEETSLVVVRALHDACARPVVLVRLGRVTPSWLERVRALGMSERVVELGLLPHQRMWELYNAVDCLLFPSWYEGLGMPPLEAMACGTPVVSSNAASLPEVVGDAALTAAPHDVGALAQAVRLLLENPTRRQELVTKGLSRSRLFTWERTVDETLRVYERVVERSRPA